MKKADNFDASKWLVENKITFQSRLNENEEFSGDFPSLDYNTITNFIKSKGYKITSDYYDSGFDVNDGEYFVGVFDDHIAITGDDGQVKDIPFNESRLNEEEYSSERINQRDVEIAGGEVINHTFDTVDMIDLDNGYKVKITTTYYFRDPGVKGYSDTLSKENPALSGVKTTLMDSTGKPIKNHNFTGSGQWIMLQGGKEYFMPQIKAWWEDKMGKLGLSESRLNEDLTDEIAALPNHHTAENTEDAILVVGKYAVVRYDESDEGGENMYVVWDNTVNQDEIGSYDDVPEFESTEPAEVAAFLKKNESLNEVERERFLTDEQKADIIEFMNYGIGALQQLKQDRMDFGKKMFEKYGTDSYKSIFSSMFSGLTSMIADTKRNISGIKGGDHDYK